jgi:hypothetical protein
MVSIATLCTCRGLSSLEELNAQILGSRKPYHPLASPSPSIRNIAVPDIIHARRGSKDVLTAEALKKRAQKALALKLKQDVLWEGAVVSDKAHHIAQHILNLRTNAKYRRSRQMLIAGGASFIQELCNAGHKPNHIIVSSKVKDVPDWAHNSSKEGLVVMNRSVLDEVAPGTDGFLADFDTPDPPPIENLIANKLQMDRVLVLDNVSDAGQLGTMLRTAAGFSYDAILLVNHCADLYDPKVVSAARGAQFQTATPIYQLREEDGDDAAAMIRHVTQRNKLEPLCFSPRTTLASQTENVSSDGASSATLHAASSRSLASTVKSLSSFCVDTFSRPPLDPHGARGGSRGGHILFAGPDHKGNLLQRTLSASSTFHKGGKPITMLTLDEPHVASLTSGTDQMDDEPAEFVASLSCVLYALRPSGQWEYLPADQQASTGADAALLHKSRTDFNDRIVPVSEYDVNLTHEEIVAWGHKRNEDSKAKRLRERRRTDYSSWMKAEEDRIHEMKLREGLRQTEPWVEQGPAKHKGASAMSVETPNIINDYRQPLDRDLLRQERDDAQSHVRPTNYDRRIVKGGQFHGSRRKAPARL